MTNRCINRFVAILLLLISLCLSSRAEAVSAQFTDATGNPTVSTQAGQQFDVVLSLTDVESLAGFEVKVKLNGPIAFSDDPACGSWFAGEADIVSYAGGGEYICCIRPLGESISGSGDIAVFHLYAAQGGLAYLSVSPLLFTLSDDNGLTIPCDLPSAIDISIEPDESGNAPIFIEFPLTGYITGDVNGDGKVNVLDLIQLRNCLGSDPLHSRPELACDVNGDGGIDVLDLIIVRNKLNNTDPVALNIVQVTIIDADLEEHEFSWDQTGRPSSYLGNYTIPVGASIIIKIVFDENPPCSSDGTRALDVLWTTPDGGLPYEVLTEGEYLEPKTLIQVLPYQDGENVPNCAELTMDILSTGALGESQECIGPRVGIRMGDGPDEVTIYADGVGTEEKYTIGAVLAGNEHPRFIWFYPLLGNEFEGQSSIEIPYIVTAWKEEGDITLPVVSRNYDLADETDNVEWSILRDDGLYITPYLPGEGYITVRYTSPSGDVVCDSIRIRVIEISSMVFTDPDSLSERPEIMVGGIQTDDHKARLWIGINPAWSDINITLTVVNPDWGLPEEALELEDCRPSLSPSSTGERSPYSITVATQEGYALAYMLSGCMERTVTIRVSFDYNGSHDPYEATIIVCGPDEAIWTLLPVE